MGLFKRLFRLSAGVPDAAAQIKAALFYGEDRLEVKGESFYQESLRQVVEQLGGEVPAILVPEPENQHDPNAVSVWCGGLKVGYLSREDAAVYHVPIARLMQREGTPIALSGRIFGGEAGKPSLGIWLYHDPADFGLASARGRRAPPSGDPSDILTGSSSGALRWMDTLPADRLAAIKVLRTKLEKETDAIQRHFMFNTLEEYLYACREIFASALAEFEEVCERHHSEMGSIRAALVADFNGLPVLPTYRQMAIMKQKTHDYGAVIVWAERGLAVYGEECLRQEVVTDLRKRLDKARAKLA